MVAPANMFAYYPESVEQMNFFESLGSTFSSQLERCENADDAAGLEKDAATLNCVITLDTKTACIDT